MALFIINGEALDPIRNILTVEIGAFEFNFN
jgi:hypothetical protein